MRLKNGSDEEQAIINVVWSHLLELQRDHGKSGLLVARRYAMGATSRPALLVEYGLVTSRGSAFVMSQSAKNIIKSAITQHGALVNPVQR